MKFITPLPNSNFENNITIVLALSDRPWQIEHNQHTGLNFACVAFEHYEHVQEAAIFNYDEIPDPIEGPLEPEIPDARQREIPFTQPFVKVEEGDIPVEYVKPIIKPIDPFQWVADRYGDDW